MEWINLISALSAIAVPLLVLHIGNKFSTRMEQERSLQKDRITLYKDLLEPIFILWTPENIIEKENKFKGKKKEDIANGILLSKEYHDKMFEMSLIAPDSVVKAFNEYYQYIYSHKEENDRLIELWAKIMLEIRKSMGNSNTSLHYYEMLEWKITDISSRKVNGKYPN